MAMIEFVKIPEERIKILRRDKEQVKKLEQLAEVKIDLGEDVTIESDDSVKNLLALQVIKAFGRGFDLEDALNLLDDEYKFEIIEMREFCGKSKGRLMALKGRVIGTGGKTKKVIEEITGAKVVVYGKTICILGRWDEVNLAKKAVEMLLFGSLHNTVYKFLNEHKK